MTPGVSARRVWRQLSSLKLSTTKLSTRNLEKLCRAHATDHRTLVVHSEDVDHRPYFPNAYTVTTRKEVPADLHVDRYYRDLREIEPSSYDIILCTGLLEHVPDPQRLIDEFCRILKPGGKLILSVSAVFPFHECPEDFFHFTPYGLELLFKQWSSISIKGSSQPFETIGILLQRITLQCEIVFPVRLLVESFAHLFRLLDRFIIRQYNTLQSYGNDQCLSDSMMPSNLQAVGIK